MMRTTDNTDRGARRGHRPRNTQRPRTDSSNGLRRVRRHPNVEHAGESPDRDSTIVRVDPPAAVGWNRACPNAIPLAGRTTRQGSSRRAHDGGPDDAQEGEPCERRTIANRSASVKGIWATSPRTCARPTWGAAGHDNRRPSNRAPVGGATPTFAAKEIATRRTRRRANRSSRSCTERSRRRRRPTRRKRRRFDRASGVQPATVAIPTRRA